MNSYTKFYRTVPFFCIAFNAKTAAAFEIAIVLQAGALQVRQKHPTQCDAIDSFLVIVLVVALVVAVWQHVQNAGLAIALYSGAGCGS